MPSCPDGNEIVLLRRRHTRLIENDDATIGLIPPRPPDAPIPTLQLYSVRALNQAQIQTQRPGPLFLM